MRRVKTSYWVFVLLLLVATFAARVESQAPQATGITVFEGARLIVGDGGAPIENAAFVVQNNRFTQVGRRVFPACASCAPFPKCRAKRTVLPSPTFSQSQNSERAAALLPFSQTGDCLDCIIQTSCYKSRTIFICY
jgi:hypothetical protein